MLDGSNMSEVTEPGESYETLRPAKLGETDVIAPPGSVNILTLAETIKNAQGPEIDQLTTWLGGWGQDAAASM
jgi:hypothetical protein